MKRRSFLQAMLAAGVAPAAIGSGILMPVREIIVLNKSASEIIASVIVLNSYSDNTHAFSTLSAAISHCEGLVVPEGELVTICAPERLTYFGNNTHISLA